MLFIAYNYVQQMSFPCIHWLFILYNSALSVPVINYLHQNKLKCEIEGNNSCFNFAYTQLLKFSVHFTSCHTSELQLFSSFFNTNRVMSYLHLVMVASVVLVVSYMKNKMCDTLCMLPERHSCTGTE